MKITFTSIITDASSPVTISWEQYPQATSYNLYYSDIADFTNTKVIHNITSPYTFHVENPQKTYYFFLTAIINAEEKKISEEFISSYLKSTLRYNIAPSFITNLLKQSASTSSLPQASMIAGYEQPGYSTATIQGPLQISISFQHPAKLFTAMEYWHLASDNISPYADIGYAVWIYDPRWGTTTDSAEYKWNPAVGYMEPIQTGIFTISNKVITYHSDKPEAGYYEVTGWGYDGVDYNINLYTNPVPATLDSTMNGLLLTQISDVLEGNQFLRFGLLEKKNKKKLKSIAITPDNATIYIHHTNPDKQKQQYTAMGTYDDNGTTITENVTTNVDWYSSMPERARMDNVVGIGKAIANVSPGITEIHATSLLPAPDNIQSNIAKLKVACWEHKYWMQNDARWSDVLYANHIIKGNEMYKIGARPVYWGTIGGTGCLTTDISMIILTTGTWSQPDNLNQDMKINGYYTNNDVNPETLAEYSNDVIKSSYYASKYGVDIRAALDNCDFVVVAIPPSSGGTGSHWVVVTGYEEGTDTYYILNPANSNKTKITFDMIQGGDASILIGSIHDSVI